MSRLTGRYHAFYFELYSFRDPPPLQLLHIDDIIAIKSSSTFEVFGQKCVLGLDCG